jgi:hypothetical protein
VADHVNASHNHLVEPDGCASNQAFIIPA